MISFAIEGSAIVPCSKANPRKKQDAMDILTWVEAFNSYAAVLNSYFPHRARDLSAYMALIIRTAKRFGGRAWLQYDRAFRREAEASFFQDWSAMTPDLYNYTTQQPMVIPHHRYTRKLARSAFAANPGDHQSPGNSVYRGIRADVSAPEKIVVSGMHVTSRDAPKETIVESTSIPIPFQPPNAKGPRNVSPVRAEPRFSDLYPHRKQITAQSPGHINTNVTGNSQSAHVSHSLAHIPIHINNLEMQLLAHPDRSKVDYVVTGLREGFKVGFHTETIQLKSAKRNCPSANKHPEVIDEYLAHEIKTNDAAELKFVNDSSTESKLS